MLWIAIALMTGAAVLCVVWPMSKPRAADWNSGADDIAFYREQMRALEVETANGLLAPAEAAGSRAEIGRRLIAAAERAGVTAAAPGRRRRLFGAAIAVMIAIPAASLGLYAATGAPELRDMPLASRDDRPVGNELATAIARVERHLASHPDDGKGFAVLAPLYLRLGQFSEASHAYERALILLGETADRRAGYGQALMLQADGVVTADARAAFEQAAKDDPSAPQPQFYLGLAAAQDGDKDRARAVWTKLIDGGAAEAPWAPMVRTKLAELDRPPTSPALSGSPAATGPASSAGAAIAALPADQQGKAIRGMVDGLAARLAQDGRDKEGWLRLLRAYAVLGEKEKAASALGDAKKSLSADPQGLAQVDALARELGLES